MKDSKDMMDMALAKIMEDLDDIEGKSAITHDAQSCLDPENCEEHCDSGPMGKPAITEVEVHQMGKPSIIKSEGSKELGPDEIDALKKLLK